jgi:hypothetical protein
MTALLRVMVLCGASPPELVALLLPRLLPADRVVAAQNAISREHIGNESRSGAC